METRIKTVRRFYQQYRSLSFSELMSKADDEYLSFVAEMDEEGRVVRESKFDAVGELEEKNEFRYSPGGKLVEHVLLFAVEDVTERRVLRRDEKDLLLEELKMYGDDTGERTTYSYDPDGKPLEIVHYDEEGELDHREEVLYTEAGEPSERKRYDKSNRLVAEVKYLKSDVLTVEQKDYSEEGKLLSVSIIRYDAAGNEVSYEQSTPDGKLISAVYSTYDERGNALERVYKDFYSKTVRSSYDESNRLLSQELFDGSGLLLRKNLYDYDENGRLAAEQVFEIDASGGGRDKHYGTRYEYDSY
ncbi:MAG: hypothetical protein RL213_198 [Bacteroidota bacterium]|jgi:uncharacterized protein RhaS with RHS repeats